MILRGILLVAGLVALARAIALDRPESLTFTGLAGVVLVVVCVGATVGDCITWRAIPAIASAATAACGFVPFARSDVHVPIAVVVVVLQVVAILAGRPVVIRRSGAPPRTA